VWVSKWVKVCSHQPPPAPYSQTPSLLYSNVKQGVIILAAYLYNIYSTWLWNLHAG
jgi:hypothetical protein